MPERVGERLKITCTHRGIDDRPCGWYHTYHVTDPANLRGRTLTDAQRIQGEKVQQCIKDFFTRHTAREHPMEAQAITASIDRVVNHLTVKYLAKLIYTEQV